MTVARIHVGGRCQSWKLHYWSKVSIWTLYRVRWCLVNVFVLYF